MRTVGRTALALVSLLSAGLALTACTASDRPSTLTNTPTATATAPAASDEPAAEVSEPSGPPCEESQYQVTGEAGAKPTITVPTGCKPQDGLLAKDLVPGTGPEIKAGSTAELHYVLATFSDGRTREASWDGDKPLQLQNIGQAQVIQGWNEGLIGLKEGGRRLLVVPAEKGYGDRGKDDIAPGETLVFVVDAVKVQS
ncbi:FKBP-type peptidyl-prolyl cis-trans isomerase [Saccharothrix algeriensis]|uniref:Peptidyl-prolyl cis-trans isomerase n=1 Tax=Saccharothrix algeriensis TaxID=173560 RepID=A0A8T8HVB8_9PSEU|nr:FKBP-type peptidyl-prolyl cis-trans isomerase [Saccharothrix algeriensis]MBM7814086.1 peptidylprolyl isomerase [Saccharothrix algeriensis]QTR02478.1 FKBP-type peptidyl-prolyl cis-trans isomerase [Saccharothrix algeriensis]